MRIEVKSLWLVMIVVITGCTPAYNQSMIIERPDRNLESLLIVIEEPAFSAPASEKEGVLKVDSKSGTALDRYRSGFYQAVRRDFVRVMGDNGISSKLVFVTPLGASGSPLDGLSTEDRSQWPYALAIRHVRGISQCRYGACEAFFQTEARLFETAKGRLIWSAHGEGGQFYGQKVWSDGRMYKFLLDRLGADGIIKIRGSGPAINLGAKNGNDGSP